MNVILFRKWIVVDVIRCNKVKELGSRSLWVMIWLFLKLQDGGVKGKGGEETERKRKRNQER